MKYLSVLLYLLVSLTCLGQAPSFKLVSAINYTPTITFGSYETVSVTVKNTGAAGTFDFECDLENTSNGFISVIGKDCGVTVPLNGTPSLTFSLGQSTDVNSISPPSGPGTYRINLIVSKISGTCPGCGTKPVACISPISVGNYANPVPLTVVAAQTCTNWSVSPSAQSGVPSGGGSYSATVGAAGTGCSYNLTFNNTWLHFVSSGSNGLFNYSVDVNSAAQRTGTISINDVTDGINNITTLSVTQNAAVATYLNSNFSNSTGCSGQTSYFYDASNGSPSPNYWYWTFGDGNSSNTQNPTHVYSSSGYYNISLYVQNSAGNYSTSTGQIYVPPSNVSASFVYTAGYAGQTTSFSDNSNYGCGSPNSWTWNFGDGYTSYSQNPNHVYSASGAYNVQLTACNNLGYCNSYPQSITIPSLGQPNPNFYASPTLISAGESTNFYNTSTNSSSYQWQFTSGSPQSSTQTNPTFITYNTPGTYSVLLTATNGQGSVSNPKHGYINVKPSAVHTVIPDALYNHRTGNPHPHAVDPVDLATGTYGYHHDDLSMQVVNGTATVSRYYNTAKKAYDNGLGYGWNHNWDFKVVNERDTIWRVFYPDGHAAPYIVLSSDSFHTFPLYEGMRDSLSKDASGNYILTTLHGITYTFAQFDSNKNGHLSTITDRNGNTTSLSYNGSLLSTVALPGGRSFSFFYDGTNHLTSITDPLNRVVSYIYAGNDLQTVTDADLGVTHFEYDSLHQMIRIVLPEGNQLLSNIYQNGRVVSQTDGETNTTTIVYDTVARATTVSYPGSASATYYYDSLFRQIQMADELGYSTYQSYDSLENIISTTDRNGHTTTYDYDTRCNLLAIHQPLGVNYYFTYTDSNDVATSTDPKGKTTVYQRDTKGNLTGVSYPNSTSVSYGINSSTGQVTSFTNGNVHTTNYSYYTGGELHTKATPTGTYTYTPDAIGRIVTVSDPLSHPTNISYNGKSQIVQTTDALSQSIHLGYDLNGNLTSSINKKNFPTSYTYDGNDRLVTKTAPYGGGITHWFYDTRDNVNQIQDANGHSTYFTYTLRNEKHTVTNPLTGVTTYTYDPNGNLATATDNVSSSTITYTYDDLNRNLSATNTLGQSVSQSFDLASRVISTIDGLTQAKTYIYDEVGLLKQVTNELSVSAYYTYDGNWNRRTLVDLNGHTRSISYDNDERPVTYTDAVGNAETVTYDAANNITARNKANGVNVAYTYDNINRPTDAVYTTGEHYVYAYDPDNNITSAACPTGTELYQFDSLDRVTQFTDVYANVVRYGYDAVSNRKSLTYPGNHAVTYSFNDMNEMTDVNTWTGQHYSYTYDNAGKPLTTIYPNGLVSHYGYDAANRLTLKSTAQGPNVLFSNQLTLNANGDRVGDIPTGIIPKVIQSDSRAFSYLANDFLTSDSINTFTNDLSGNRTAQTNGSDSTSYTFTADNLLKSIQHGAALTMFEYDAYGNRIKRTQGGYQKRYVLDPAAGLSQVIAETNAAGTITAYNIFGRGLLQRIDSAGRNIYYHFDARGNTTALSDDSAHLTDTFTYDPFGYVLQHIGTTVQPFTFLGQYGTLAENDSFYYMRARYYDASAMRFMSADPYPVTVSDPYSLNQYIYVYDNPFNYVDPSGLCPENKSSNALKIKGSVSDFIHNTPGLTPISANNGSTFKTVLYISGGVLLVTGAVVVTVLTAPVSVPLEVIAGGGTAIAGSVAFIETEGPEVIDEIPVLEQAVSNELSLIPKAIRALGQWGETMLGKVTNFEGIKPNFGYLTSRGYRFIDLLLDGVAHEAKAGIDVALTSKISEQILKDAELLNTGVFKDVVWHFFQGASPQVLQFLSENGIKYIVH